MHQQLYVQHIYAGPLLSGLIAKILEKLHFFKITPKQDLIINLSTQFLSRLKIITLEVNKLPQFQIRFFIHFVKIQIVEGVLKKNCLLFQKFLT